MVLTELWKYAAAFLDAREKVGRKTNRGSCHRFVVHIMSVLEAMFYRQHDEMGKVRIEKAKGFLHLLCHVYHEDACLCDLGIG